MWWMTKQINRSLKLWGTLALLLSVSRRCCCNYSLKVKYQKGSLTVVSDPLPRAYLDEPPRQTEYCDELHQKHDWRNLERAISRMTTFRCPCPLPRRLAHHSGWNFSWGQAMFLVLRWYHGLKWFAAKLRKKMIEMAQFSHLGTGGWLRRACMNRLSLDISFSSAISVIYRSQHSFYSPWNPIKPLAKGWHGSLFLFGLRHYLVTVDYNLSFFHICGFA